MKIFNDELNPINATIKVIDKSAKGLKKSFSDVMDEVEKSMDAQKMINEADKLDRELRIERAKATEEVSRLRLG